jgi:hypothetical protein
MFGGQQVRLDDPQASVCGGQVGAVISRHYRRVSHGVANLYLSMNPGNVGKRNPPGISR